MKKSLILVAVLCLLTVGLFAAARPRTYTQVLVDGNGNQFPDVENPAPTHNPNYKVRAWVTARPTEITSTETHPAVTIRVNRFGNGSVAVPFATISSLNFSAWETDWTPGEIVHMEVTHLPTSQVQSWEIVIPPGGGAIGHRQIDNPFPTGIVCDFWGVTTHTISGTFTTTSWDLTNVMIDATDILPEDITYDAITGAYAITVPDGWTGRVEPTKLNYIIEPNFVDYTNVTADAENQNYVIKMDVNPEAPAITFPAAGQVFTWAAAQPVTATWTPPAGFVPEYYEIKFGATDWTSVNQDLSWTTDALGAGDYTFYVRGVINTPQAKAYVPISAKSTARSANTSSKGRGNGAEAMVNFQVIIAIPELSITSEPPGAAIMLAGAPIGQNTPYMVSVAGTYTVELADYTFDPVEYVWDGLADANVHFVGTMNPPDILEGDPTIVPGTSYPIIITITGGDANIAPTGEFPAWPNGAFVATNGFFIELLGAGPWTITFATTQPWVAYYLSGNWVAVESIGGVATFTVTDPGKGPIIPIVEGPVDLTLPVELSVFNAVLTAQKFVELTWISESESNMMGYRVYRNETQEVATAILITPVMIPATNTSSTQVYNLTDREVLSGNSYYYWLEAADYGHSVMYGPQYVEVTAEITPELPVQTTMRNAYPNPFKANTNTNIDVAVKAGENGTVTIYNVLGQVVQTYKVGEGNHNLKWNGRDNRGNACGSGIYFYKLSTPSMNQTKKMVIVK